MVAAWTAPGHAVAAWTHTVAAYSRHDACGCILDCIPSAAAMLAAARLRVGGQCESERGHRARVDRGALAARATAPRQRHQREASLFLHLLRGGGGGGGRGKRWGLGLGLGLRLGSALGPEAWG